MITYRYTTSALGPAKHHDSLEDAIDWMADYAVPLPMVMIPRLHVEREDGSRVGTLYIVERDVKIMFGSTSPDIVHICSLLRNAYSRRLRKAAVC